MNLVSDCFKLIRDQLVPQDWVALTLTCQQHYCASTAQERAIILQARKGLPHCIVNGNLEAAIVLLKFKADGNSSSNSLIMASAYNHADIVKWLLQNRPEVKQGLHAALYLAYINHADQVIPILLNVFNFKRRYSCNTNIKFGKVNFHSRTLSYFCFKDYQAGKYESSRHEDRQVLGDLICKAFQ